MNLSEFTETKPQQINNDRVQYIEKNKKKMC